MNYNYMNAILHSLFRFSLISLQCFVFISLLSLPIFSIFITNYLIVTNVSRFSINYSFIFPLLFVGYFVKSLFLLVSLASNLWIAFSRLFWLFRVFCVSIQIFKIFGLVLWKMPLIFAQRLHWVYRLPWIIWSF